MVKEMQMKTTLRHKVHIHTGNLLRRLWGSGRSAHGWFKCKLMIFVKSCGEQLGSICPDIHRSAPSIPACILQMCCQHVR